MTSGGWIKFYREDIEAEKALTEREFRLFQWFKRRVGWDKNRPKEFLKVVISIKQIADELGWKESTAGAALRSLVKKGFVDRSRKYREFRLRSNYVWQSMSKIQQQVSESKLKEMGRILTKQMRIPPETWDKK